MEASSVKPAILVVTWLLLLLHSVPDLFIVSAIIVIVRILVREILLVILRLHEVLLMRVTVSTIVRIHAVAEIVALFFKSGGFGVVPATEATFRMLGSIKELIAARSRHGRLWLNALRELMLSLVAAECLLSTWVLAIV